MYVHRCDYAVHYFENIICSLNTNFTRAGLLVREYTIHFILQPVNKDGNVINYYCNSDSIYACI